MDLSGITRINEASGATTRSAMSAGSSSKSSSSTTASSSSDAVFYSSPIFTQDALTGALIQVWRDTSTGEQISQSPTRAALLYSKSQDLVGSSAKSESRTSSASLNGDSNRGVSFLA